MLISVFIACLCLGAMVGFSAGLLGIGGGLLIVPALVYMLPALGIEPSLVMTIALATSLAAIVITSSSAAFAHHRNGNIPWAIAKQLMVVVGLGSLLGAFIADTLSVRALTYIFAIAVFILSSYMFLSLKITKTKAMPGPLVVKVIGLFTGTLASLMGISGGAILVPVLSYFSLPMRQAIGAATACGLVIAVFGVIGYIIAGLDQHNLPSFSLGYVYLPALLGIVLTSSFFAPLGVKWATKLPVRTLKKMFAVFLMLVAIKMMIG